MAMACLEHVFQDNSIYLHCALEGKKLAYLRRHNKVTFCVVGEAEPAPEKYSMKYKSVIVFGRASEINPGRKGENLNRPREKILY